MIQPLNKQVPVGILNPLLFYSFFVGLVYLTTLVVPKQFHTHAFVANSETRVLSVLGQNSLK